MWPAPSGSGSLPSTRVPEAVDRRELASPRRGSPVSRGEVKAVGTFGFPHLSPAKGLGQRC